MNNETDPQPVLDTDWAALPKEPCRYCHQIGSVFFLVDNSTWGRNQPQTVQCKKCNRVWEADSSSA